MEFELNEEQRILQNTARDFLKKECPKELVRELDDSQDGHSPELWQKMADLGWIGLTLPEQYEGIGWSFLDLVILLEEMGYNICPGPFFSTSVLGSPPIVIGGSDEQKSELLPKIAGGQLIVTLALTEPTGRYDASGVTVKAVPDGEDYIINGTKLFVPDAGVADYILCVTRTNEGTNPEEGISIFLVDAKSSGLTVTSLKTIARDKQYEVLLDNVKVPAANIIGTVGQGWPIVKETLEQAAAARCAEMIGGAQAAMDLALAYAKERVQFDRPIGSFQAVQHHFANMWLEIFGVRYLVYQAACKISQGQPAEKEVSMAKARVGQAYRKVTLLAHQIFGGIGFTWEHDLHLYHKRALAGDLAFGGTDFHHEKVARSLGL